MKVKDENYYKVGLEELAKIPLAETAISMFSRTPLHPHIGVNHIHHLPTHIFLLRQPFSIINAKDPHSLMVF